MADSFPRTGDPERPGSSEDIVAELRQRLAFYEEFDEIIRDNVARSGELLRQASHRERDAERAVAEARAEGARRAAAQQRLLAELATEVAGLRGVLDAVAGRLAEAADQLGDEIRAPSPPPSPSPPTTAAAGDARTLAPASAAPPVSPTDRAAGAPEIQEAPAARWAATLIVHGVGGVEEARRLQAALYVTPGVVAVAAREFAQGVLRLELSGDGATPVDLAGWAVGNGLQVVEMGPGVLVVREPGAAGL
ncbi:MAG: hypothetical protein IT337_13915 [Thermomicrobiales bacterium]|nr:hypothetical protein [Thermomicrobiales bacterium]